MRECAYWQLRLHKCDLAICYGLCLLLYAGRTHSTDTLCAHVGRYVAGFPAAPGAAVHVHVSACKAAAGFWPGFRCLSANTCSNTGVARPVAAQPGSFGLQGSGGVVCIVYFPYWTP
jgi:hypothetical protein